MTRISTSKWRRSGACCATAPPTKKAPHRAAQEASSFPPAAPTSRTAGCCSPRPASSAIPSTTPTGGHVGPDLTGSNRSDLDYILEKRGGIPTPSSPADYRTTQIETTDDRTILGIVKKEDDKSVTVAMPGQEIGHAQVRDQIAKAEPIVDDA